MRAKTKLEASHKHTCDFGIRCFCTRRINDRMGMILPTCKLHLSRMGLRHDVQICKRQLAGPVANGNPRSAPHRTVLALSLVENHNHNHNHNHHHPLILTRQVFYTTLSSLSSLDVIESNHSHILYSINSKNQHVISSSATAGHPPMLWSLKRVERRSKAQSSSKGAIQWTFL